ncbi:MULTISPECIES: S1 family peptidase [unclassified Streptomyces]|uniref:S1 family peptidase n=1 Tax=unclassified Streptomyces TaxID=2593676 RepID=UPI0006F9E1E4|nr:MULTISPECIES: S1 family peptidase [unclassified Streptomyces]KQX46329.1 peptidase S1 [Streptomyces sp. Root1304]KRA81114.1 peptidase S1 [Streptomyces sp. Root66D1]
MTRIPTLRTAAAALLLTLGLTAGVGAGQAAPASAAPADGAPRASDGLLDAMRQDLGLTERQAEARLDAERVATRVESAVRTAAGGSYGGSWFDPGTGRLVVALTDRTEEAEVRALGADTRLVRYGAGALDRAKGRLDALTAPAGIAGWHVDPRANSVVVTVVGSERSTPAVRAFVEKARAVGPVTVAETSAAPRTYAAGTVGGDPYYTGNVRCSIGFSVHGGFVIAGHCGGAGAAVRGWDGSAMGTFQGSSFPGNDYAYVSIHSGWWTVPVVLGWGTIPDRLVRGSAEAPVGTSVCRSGSTTHWHCGTVLAKNETVNYSQGAVYQMTKTSVCAEGGDSGGAFISGDQAQGVTSGGWGNCSTGGETWFQPVNEILGRYGLTLHTA